MPIEPKRHRLDERRPFSSSGSAYCGLRRRVYGERIIAVDPDTWDAIARGTVRDMCGGCTVAEPGVLGIGIVLTYEQHRQLPNGRQIQGLVKCTDVRRAVTEIRHRHPLVTTQLRGQRKTTSNRHAGTDDSSGDHAAALRVCDMHRAALAFAHAGAASRQLCPYELRRHAFSQHVMDAAVDRDEVVVIRQQHADSGGDALLPPRRIVRHYHLASFHKADESLIIQFDERHLPVNVYQNGAFWLRSAHASISHEVV